MTIWLISDTHFRHENIYRFTAYDGGPRIRERFANAGEGDAFMVQRWNELVKPEDHVYHLGDVTMERSSAMKAWCVAFIKQLHGHKRLVLGNHDHFAMDVYRDAGFQKVKGSHKLDNLLLSHYPIHESSIPGWCLVNAHGHIHEKAAPTMRHINMSVEQWGYEPVPLEIVKETAMTQQMVTP